MKIIISIAVPLLTALGLYLSEKSHVIKIFDDIYTLIRQLHNIKSEKIDENDMLVKHHWHERIADVQLQIKHLLIEATNTMFVRLSVPEQRLLADACEELQYYNEAEKHWKKCISKRFPYPSIKAEYYCRYAQFLYKINKEKEGCAAYRKALELKNDNDGSIYINVQTYSSWICNILGKIKMGGYKSYHSIEDSADYYVPLVKGLLKEMNNLSGMIKDACKRDECYKQVKERDKGFLLVLLLSAKTQNLAYAHTHTHTSLEKKLG